MTEAEHKKCPYCYEMIKFQAVKCKFCHSFLDESNGKHNSKSEKKTINENPSGHLINEIENTYYQLKFNNPKRDEHWLLAKTWLSRYGDTEHAKQIGREAINFIAYKDTLNFSVLKSPESIRALSLFLVYKELGEEYAVDYVGEFNPMMEKIISYKGKNIFFDKYRINNPRTWQENQQKTSSPYSIYWLLETIDDATPNNEDIFRSKSGSETKVCQYCQLEIPNKAIKCRYCEAFVGECLDEKKLHPNSDRRTFQKNKDEMFEELSQVRPWVRYFARLTDYFLFGAVFGLILAFISPITLFLLMELGIFATPLLIIIWNFIEALMLSSSGTTLGKWLLNTYVEDIRGNKLTYSQALSRSFQVFLKGVGLGIFPINIVTMVIAYNTLTKKVPGKTTWDLEGEYRVRHGHIKPMRIILLVVIWIFILFWMVG